MSRADIPSTSCLKFYIFSVAVPSSLKAATDGKSNISENKQDGPVSDQASNRSRNDKTPIKSTLEALVSHSRFIDNF